MTIQNTDRPFPEALAAMMAVREVGVRELARRVRKKGWGSPNTISTLLNGGLPPTINSMERIAAALDLKPEHFAEYRLAVQRRALDPRVVGLVAALRELDNRSTSKPAK